MFRTVSLSIIRSFSLYTQQWYMSHRFADSLLSINKFGKISASSWFIIRTDHPLTPYMFLPLICLNQNSAPTSQFLPCALYATIISPSVTHYIMLSIFLLYPSLGPHILLRTFSHALHLCSSLPQDERRSLTPIWNKR